MCYVFRICCVFISINLFVAIWLNSHILLDVVLVEELGERRRDCTNVFHAFQHIIEFLFFFFICSLLFLDLGRMVCTTWNGNSLYCYDTPVYYCCHYEKLKSVAYISVFVVLNKMFTLFCDQSSSFGQRGHYTNGLHQSMYSGSGVTHNN